MSGEIRQYVRRNRNGKKRVKVGILVARRVDGVPKISWSLCMKSDKFDLAEGLRVAEEGYSSNRVVPSGIKKDVTKFQERAARYFKESVVV